jgi:pimeloyl-ACP methyl ester carboxylesterase
MGTASAPDGIQIRFDSEGASERTLIFVHGWSCDRSYWKAQVRAFADRYQVVTVDLAGHGESGAGRPAYTMESFGADVVAVIDELRLDNAVIIGHSMGGDVVVEAALQRPDAVRGLVWVDDYSNLSRVRTPEQVEAFVAPFRTDLVARTRALVAEFFPPSADPALVEWVAADMASALPSVALNALEHAISTKA